MLARALLLAQVASGSATAWTGPEIKPVFSQQGGVAALSIDGKVSAAGWLVGNTQGGLDDNFANWEAEITHAAKAGVRIFGICPDGQDLLGQPTPVLSNHTRAMALRVLEAEMNHVFRQASLAWGLFFCGVSFIIAHVWA